MSPEHVTRGDLEVIRNQIADLSSELATLTGEVVRLRTEVVRMREEFAAFRMTATAPRQQTLAFPAPAAGDPFEQLVTLDQMAAMVGIAKRSLERYKASLPEPKVPGRKGRASLYSWTEVRPWLEQNFSRRLPENFPTIAG